MVAERLANLAALIKVGREQTNLGPMNPIRVAELVGRGDFFVPEALELAANSIQCRFIKEHVGDEEPVDIPLTSLGFGHRHSLSKSRHVY